MPTKNNKLLKISGPILIAVIASLITYFLGDYFDREKVEIKNISVNQNDFGFRFSRDLIDDIGEEINDQLSLFGLGDELKKQRVFYKDQVRDILLDLSINKYEINKDINEFSEQYSKLLRSKGDSSGFDISDLDLDPEETLFLERRRSSREDYINTLEKRITTKTTELESLNNLISRFVKSVNKQLESNKDDFQIEIVLFNSGKTQAVVRYKANIEYGDIFVNLRRKRNENFSYSDKEEQSQKDYSDRFLDDLIIIEPKSFNGMTLVLDNYNNKQNDLAKIRSEYYTGQKEMELILYDISNSIFEKVSFILKNDLDRDQGESLKNFIDKEYGEFLEN